MPDLALSTEEGHHIGVWGCGSPVATFAEGRSTDRGGSRDQRHRRYLKKNHRILYYNLLTACKLNSYLADVDQRAEEMFFRLVKQLVQKERVTEKLKAEDGMRWVQMMNSIRNRAAEVVYNDLIYN